MEEKELNFLNSHIGNIYAKIDQFLFDAQKRYENAIKQYGIFRNKWVDKQVEYEKAFADEVQRLKNNDQPVTITKELAKQNLTELKKEMLELETKYKYFKALRDGMQERIQTIKFLGRIKHNMTN